MDGRRKAGRKTYGSGMDSAGKGRSYMEQRETEQRNGTNGIEMERILNLV